MKTVDLLSKVLCCFYILFAKQYAVFTTDKDKAGVDTSCYIKGDKIFLAAVANHLKKVAKELHARAEAVENELKEGKDDENKVQV